LTEGECLITVGGSKKRLAKREPERFVSFDSPKDTRILYDKWRISRGSSILDKKKGLRKGRRLSPLQALQQDSQSADRAD